MRHVLAEQWVMRQVLAEQQISEYRITIVMNTPPMQTKLC
jgi:hypothetical protein